MISFKGRLTSRNATEEPKKSHSQLSNFDEQLNIGQFGGGGGSLHFEQSDDRH